MKIRVLRVLEYLYDDVERMTEDMERWAVPQTGVKQVSGMAIRSATFPASLLLETTD